MANTNYFSGIVRILKIYKQKVIRNNLLVTEILIEIPQSKKNLTGLLIFYESANLKTKNYYKKNDYLLIEGSILLNQNRNKNLLLTKDSNLLIICKKMHFLSLKTKG